MRRALPLLLLAACEPNPEPGPTFIAPLDGQTDVALGAPLRVHVGALQLPPDYPIPDDFVRVVEVERPGFVSGALRWEGDEVTFTPDGGWEPGRRYVWSVGEVARLDRAPEYAFPEAVYGEAVFATSGATHVLDAGLDAGAADRVCAVLSRRVDAVDHEIAVTIDDEPAEVGEVVLHDEATWLDLADDAGVTVACFPDLAAPPGASLRIWWGDERPWQVNLAPVDLTEVLAARRRARP